MKVLTVVGARPQFIKAAPVSSALRQAGHDEFLVHTGQHYDRSMSQIFFDELGIPEPDINLLIGSGPHGWQVGQMLIRLEEVISEQRPDWVLVYGDTNSTLAGALAAAKLRVRLAHVEAGLRSFNREMPEEHNRVLTDHCADILFCPTMSAVANLKHEGVTRGVYFVGDTMYEAVLQYAAVALHRSTILGDLKLTPKRYSLVTVHRAYNTDVAENLRDIIAGLNELDEPIVFPVHPRTRQSLKALQLNSNDASPNLLLIDPVGYLDMLALEQNARVILTDSGGVQKEAYFFAVPCVTIRSETEWTETVEAGWNVVAGIDAAMIKSAVHERMWPEGKPAEVFGDGQAASHIVARLADNLHA